jgi:hypothetical protein
MGQNKANPFPSQTQGNKCLVTKGLGNNCLILRKSEGKNGTKSTCVGIPDNPLTRISNPVRNNNVTKPKIDRTNNKRKRIISQGHSTGPQTVMPHNAKVLNVNSTRRPNYFNKWSLFHPHSDHKLPGQWCCKCSDIYGADGKLCNKQPEQITNVTSIPGDNIEKTEYDLNREKNKRIAGRKQNNKRNAIRSAPTYEPTKQDTRKIFCEDELYDDSEHEECFKNSGKKALWRVCSPVESSAVDIDAPPFDAVEWKIGEIQEEPPVLREEAREEKYSILDEPIILEETIIDQPVQAPILDGIVRPVSAIPIGFKWEWYDNKDWFSYRCTMVKVVDLEHLEPQGDERPDSFRGADMVHDSPMYSQIEYKSTPVFRSGLITIPYGRPKTTILVVSEEVATQIITASNCNFTMDAATVFNRITNAAKSVAKVNDNRSLVLQGLSPRNDTIVFANNVAKFYFYTHRNLKNNLDFVRNQDEEKLFATVIGRRKSAFLVPLNLRRILCLLFVAYLIVVSLDHLFGLVSAVTYLVPRIQLLTQATWIQYWMELVGGMLANPLVRIGLRCFDFVTS